MVIAIQKFARDMKLSIPDLITRPVGRELYIRIAKKFTDIHDGEVVVIDFKGYKVLDPSFIDEFIIRLLERSRNEHPRFHIKLSGISETAIHNILHVMKSYRVVKGKRFAVATDRLINKHNIIGELTAEEIDIIRFLSINQGTTSAEISLFLETGIEETNALLEEMYAMGIIRKQNVHSNTFYCTI